MSGVSLPFSGAEMELAQWLARRAESALVELGDCVERNPAKMGGDPVFRGSRISVSQILAELGEGQSADDIAADFDLDAALVKRLIQGLALSLERAARGNSNCMMY